MSEAPVTWRELGVMLVNTVKGLLTVGSWGAVFYGTIFLSEAPDRAAALIVGGVCATMLTEKMWGASK